MKYKSALKLLSNDSIPVNFTARGLSDMLLGLLEQPVNILDYGLLAPTCSTKRLSGDLDRLYRMGFLNRKRIKRIVNPRNSLPVARGFTYLYRISTQGSQYLEYLKNPKLKGGEQSPVDLSERLLLSNIVDDMHKRYPEWIAKFMEKGLLPPHEDRGRYNRFPSKTNGELSEALAECRRNLARKEKEIQDLKKIQGTAI